MVNINEIPLEDIFEYYRDADKPTRQAVSLLLEDETVRWLLSTINVDRLEKSLQGRAGRENEIGVGFYKAEGNLVPQLIGVGLNAFAGNPPAREQAILGVSSWIAQAGGDILLKHVAETVNRMLDL